MHYTTVSSTKSVNVFMNNSWLVFRSSDESVRMSGRPLSVLCLVMDLPMN